jgi:hypothetical protein
MKQVARAINIFEAKTNGLAQGLFVFDNAPGHMKHALDGVTAKGMVKGVSQSFCFFVYLNVCLYSSQTRLNACTEQAMHAC